MKKIALHNLGCKVNGYELDRIARELTEEGFKTVPFDEAADVYLVNTCTVTNIADRKSRQMLHRARKMNPEALVVALGCFVDVTDEEAFKENGVDIALGNTEKSKIVKILKERFAAGEEASVPFRGEYGAGEGAADKGRTRAFLKIQDGCNLFCTYCIIPYARGRSVSFPPERIFKEAAELAERGYREIVLTGIHISSYHAEDRDGKTMLLTDLVERLHETEGIERIRLGSLEPRIITKERAKRLSSLPKLCPHFHLSLQSGCDKTLQRMKRRYTAEQYRESVGYLREAFSRPAITTDVIVGFPGESGADFEESRRFIEETEFYETHVFKYSARKGTPAAKMPGQLTEREKAARSAVLLKMNAEASERYRRLFIGEDLTVLWEEAETIDNARYMIGHTGRYVRVALPTPAETGGVTEEALKGRITTVRAGGMLRADTILAKSFELV